MNYSFIIINLPPFPPVTYIFVCLVAGKVSEERDNTLSTPASHC